MAIQDRPRVYTVTEVNHHIKSLFEEDRALRAILVKGELSNVKYASSGHLYFSLKDETSQINCVMWASEVRKMNDHIKHGESVTVFGEITVYERDGNYRIYVKAIRKEGITGVLYERYEALKKKLLEMGMFDEIYKKQIPPYIRTLGVVTSTKAAGLRDIINVSRRRNPGIRIILSPATVQGDGAAESIAHAIEALDALGCADVIIVGRGGGSIEELWAFNEEIVAKAIWNCKTPVISAVGHDTDTTIADYVADLRAPTPSAGAEIAVADMASVLLSFQEYSVRLSQLMHAALLRTRQLTHQYSLMLQLRGPEGRLKQSQQFLISSNERLDRAMEVRFRETESSLDRLRETMNRQMADRLRKARHALELLESRLKALSPMLKLDAGYAYIEDENHRAVRSAGSVKKGDALNIRFRDGTVHVVALQVDTD